MYYTFIILPNKALVRALKIDILSVLVVYMNQYNEGYWPPSNDRPHLVSLPVHNFFTGNDPYLLVSGMAG